MVRSIQQKFQEGYKKVEQNYNSETTHNPKTEDREKSVFAKFDDWTGSEENFNKFLNGEDVEDFKMFDLDLSTYSKDLKAFAQGYIDNYDADEDSNLNFEEFVRMASDGEQDPNLLSVASELYNLYKGVYEEQIIPQNDKDNDSALNMNEFIQALGYDPNKLDEQTRKDVENVFTSLNTDKNNENQLLDADELLVGLNPTLENLDSKLLQQQTKMYNMFNTQYSELDLDNDGQASSGEFATMLYASDVDWNNFKATGGDIASSIDGKLDYKNYQAYSSLDPSTEQGQNLKMQRQAFFDNFYAQ